MYRGCDETGFGPVWRLQIPELPAADRPGDTRRHLIGREEHDMPIPTRVPIQNSSLVL
jgi:hypothetical protein